MRLRAFRHILLLILGLLSLCTSVCRADFLGQYYTDQNCSILGTSRLDANGSSSLSVNFLSTPPPSPLVPANGYSVTWTAYVTPTVSQNYQFTVDSDDGSALYILPASPYPVINYWTHHATGNPQTASVYLSAGTTYEIVLQYFEDGAGQASVNFTWSGGLQPSAALPPPTSTTATANSSNIFVFWNGPPANFISTSTFGYKVKRSTTRGGPYQVIATVPGSSNSTSYNDVSVQNGTTYYYVVSTYTLSDESANSNEASATYFTPPAVPTGLTATGQKSAVALAWTPAANATGYAVFRSTTSGGAYSYIAGNINGTTYTDSSVTAGTTYYYVVTSTNAGGASAYSNEAKAKPYAVAVAYSINCDGPAAGPFAADNDFSGGGTAYDTAAVDTSHVTNAAPQAVYQTARIQNFSYALPNLTPGAAYTVRLHFVEGFLNGPGQRLFDVWANGVPVLYNFDIFAAAGAENTAVVQEFPVTADSGGNISLQFRSGSADNAMCCGIEVVPAGAGPAAGLSVAVTSPAAGSVFTVGGSTPVTATVTGGAVSRVDFYASTVTASQRETIVPIGTAASGTGGKYVVNWPNLPLGAWNLTAVATDGAGNTIASSPVGVRVSAGPPFIGTGTGLTGKYEDYNSGTQVYTLILSRTDPTINFNWNGAAPAPGVTSSNYGLVWAGQVQPKYSEPLTFQAATTGPVVLYINDQLVINNWTLHSGTDIASPVTLLAGQKYNVVLKNFQGTTPPSAISLSWSSPSLPLEVVPQTQLYPLGSGVAPPDPPAGVTASATGLCGQVALSWGAAAGATSYNVKRSQSPGGPFSTIQNTVSTSYTDSAATAGTTYYYEVTAVGSGGEGGALNVVSAVANGPPAAPVGLAGAAGGPSSITLAWGAPSGSVSGYNVYRSVNGGGFTLVNVGGPVGGASYSDATVTRGTGNAYCYEVSAVGPCGEGPRSAPVCVPDFFLTVSPANPSIPPSSTQALAVTITPVNGYSGTVLLGLGSTPSGLVYAFYNPTNPCPGVLGPSGSLLVPVSGVTTVTLELCVGSGLNTNPPAANTYALVLNGADTSGGPTASAPITLSVPPAMSLALPAGGIPRPSILPRPGTLLAGAPSPGSLLDGVGRASRVVPAGRLAAWRREIHAATLRRGYALKPGGPETAGRLAALHLWLGEAALAQEERPAVALWQFRRAQALSRPGDGVFGLAAYDSATAAFYAGSYREAADEFHQLLLPRTALPGYDRRACALWWRTAATCANAHAARAALGVPEPPRLDPLCGAAALAASLRALSLPCDRRTLLAACRVTGEGSSLSDLVAAGPRLGVTLRPVTADDRALVSLPKPLVAYVEHDHFVSVVRADRNGVSYLCSDCGPWPGGRVDLTWAQWHLLAPGVYATVTRPGSPWDVRLSAALGSPRPAIRVALGLGREGAPRPSVRPLLPGGTLLRGRLALFNPPGGALTCGSKPDAMRDPFGGCALDGGGGPASVTVDPVNLVTGEEEYSPGPDLVVYNPHGPPVVWSRRYNSLRGPGPGYEPSDFGVGWSQPYNVGVCDPTYDSVHGTYGVGSASMPKWLFLSNGARVNFYAPGLPTGGAVRCVLLSNGAPLLIQWNPDYSYTVTFKDRTQWRFASIDPATQCYRLTALADPMGNGLTFGYGPQTAVTPSLTNVAVPALCDWPLLNTIRDSATGAVLLTITRQGRAISSVTDAYGRSVFYAVSSHANAHVPCGYPQASLELDRVSQVVPPGVTAAAAPDGYDYGYQNVTNLDGQEATPDLHTITVPSPVGGAPASGPLVAGQAGTSTATINYDPATGFVANTVDAEGRTHAYAPGSGNQTTVTIYNSAADAAAHANPVLAYTVGWDGKMNITSVTDGTNATVVESSVYADPHTDYAPSQVTDGTGHTWAYAYDANGNLATATSPRNAPNNTVTRYTWSTAGFPLGELSQVQEGAKAPTAFTYYEPSGLLQSVTGPLPGTIGSGHTITRTFTYDSVLGNLLTVTTPRDALGTSPLYRMDNGPGHLLTATQAEYNSLIAGGWTSAGVQGYVYPNNAVAGLTPLYRLSYAGNGDHFFTTDPAARAQLIAGGWKPEGITGYVFGQAGPGEAPLFQAYNPSTGQHTYTSSASERAALLASGSWSDQGTACYLGTAPATATTRTVAFRYDADPGDPSHGVAPFTPPGGAALGLPLAITDNLGLTTHFRYDAHGNQTALIDAAGNETDATYDVDDRPLLSLLPATGQTGSGRTTTAYSYLYAAGSGPTAFHYGPLQSISLYDEGGSQARQVTYSYYPEGELRGQGGSTEPATYAYDAAYRLLSLADGNVHATHFYYNRAGYPDAVTYPGYSGPAPVLNPVTGAWDNVAGPDSARAAAYDAAGRLTRSVDGNGTTASYAYNDPDGLLTGVSYALAANAPATLTALAPTAYTYDPLYGRLSSVQDASGTRTYAYDDRDAVLSTTTAYTGLPTKTITYSYFPDGGLQAMGTPAGGFGYAFDGDGRPAAMTNPSSEVTSWAYQPNGWLAQQILGNGVTTSYAYDGLGELTDLANRQAGRSLLSDFAVPSTGTVPYGGYGGARNLRSLTATLPAAPGLGGTTAYTYDGLGELIQEQSTRNGGYSGTFSYDAAGNQQSYNWTYNADNQFNMPGFTADGDGNPTAYKGATLSYDVLDRLTNYGTAMSAGYDGADRRAWKQTGAGRTYFLYDGATPVVEMDASGNVQAVNTVGATGVVSRRAGGASVFYAFDPIGDAAERTDGTGNVLTSSLFDAWGSRAGTDGLGVFQTPDPYSGFGGQWGAYSDTETGLRLTGHRYYDPQARRFLTRDPIGYAGGINLYNYAGHNPVNDSDPSGLSSLLDGGSEDADIPGSLGAGSIGLAANEGINGPHGLVHDMDPGSYARRNISDGLRNTPIGVAMGAVEAVTGCDYVAGTQVSTAQRVMGAVGAALPLLHGLGSLGECGSIFGCFTGDTPVQMADGSLKAIKDVRPGDWVVSRDPATGKTEARQVLSTSARQTPGVLRLWLADPATGAVVQALEATPNHPLYVQGRGFVTAGQVGLGESLVSRAGPGLVVSAVERLPGDREYAVYNLVVEGDHTYFVGDAQGGAWVHNGRCYLPTVLKIKARWPINGWRAGTTFNGVPINSEGFPDFSAYAIKEVKITFTGSYSSDFADANAQAGLTSTPAGYTWHHVEDETTMQLVPTPIHQSVRHTGGVAVWEGNNGTTYKP